MRSRQVGGGASGGDPATTGYVLEYPLPAGQPVIIRNGAGLYLYRHPQPLPLGARHYADVVQATNLRDQSEDGATVTYYWAPRYGLVRRRIRALNRPAQTWTLIREHIVQ
ncbi:hypothetical protein [Hymenobacter jeollabukensis]|uniref:Uncharacterized protein n=1 Tax=Hymenobacter jeollabukensis TaxID=2025313 RepID=A0A5R8WT91_9BACT|nr:hypothetical protein [Hymenobacter jeollabukensis]TLM94058.1 hypothetical protein FDY95_08505 [Hymenobacter jeollabukensis]